MILIYENTIENTSWVQDSREWRAFSIFEFNRYIDKKNSYIDEWITFSFYIKEFSLRQTLNEYMYKLTYNLTFQFIQKWNVYNFILFYFIF